MCFHGFVCVCMCVIVCLETEQRVRDGYREKRSMFHQQMEIIHAIQVYSHQSLHNVQCMCVKKKV